jgi:GH24 family phage-related lysozyme (muramidase)
MLAVDYVADIQKHEGFVPWLYADSRGCVTIGFGNLVCSPEAAEQLPMEHDDGVPAASAEKNAAFIAVQDAFRAGLLAAAYASKTTIRMDRSTADAMLARRLDGEFLPAIEQVFHDVESWPLPARRAVVDMVYSLGISGLVRGYPKFVDACHAKDWLAAAAECHRKRQGEDPTDPSTWGERNTWTRQMLLQASAAEAAS